jgi:histidine triad (HIT) family protein
MDIFPASEGHTLVIPKQHFESVFEISESAMQAVSLAARRIASAIRAELEPDGMTIAQVNGEAAGQTVMHYHLHLLPRTRGQSMRLHGTREADPARLEALACAFAARL